MATPKAAHRCPQPPLGMKPALKAPLRSLVLLLLPSLGQLRSHVLLLPSLGRLRPRSTTAAKLVLSLRRAKPEEPSPRVLRRVRLPLNHVLLHIRSRQDATKTATKPRASTTKVSTTRKPVTRTAVKSCLPIDNS
jgi:hypothetical protein